jgi:hypothetical protein
MEVLFAAYASAGKGQNIEMPYKPTAKKPIEEWLGH